MPKYSISYSTLTDGVDLDVDALRVEINADDEISEPCTRVRHERLDGLGCYFDAALSAAEVERLDAVAAAHGTPAAVRPEPSRLLIGDYMRPPRRIFDPPMDLDFRLVQPKLHKTIGRRNGVGYVTRWDWAPAEMGPGGGVVGAPVIYEHHAYTNDPVTQVPIFRDERIAWLREDGTEHPDAKERRKFYVTNKRGTTAKAIAKEGQQRRGALLDEAIGAVSSFLVTLYGDPDPHVAYAIGQNFVDSLGSSLERYVRDTNPMILSQIFSADGATFPWLDAPLAFDETLATPVRDGSPETGNLVSARDFLHGLLNIYAAG